MSNIVSSISMSLDGYIAGPNDGPDLGLGVGGERLHEWVVQLASWREQHGLPGGERTRDDEILEEAIANLGAAVVGRRMYDNAGGWGETPPFHVPVFVVTSRPRPPLVKDGGTTFTFVTDGVESAVRQATAAAGNKKVSIGGGANVIQQALAAGLLDELHIHLIPILLGGGVRLFDRLETDPIEMTQTSVIESPTVTHLRYRFAS